MPSGFPFMNRRKRKKLETRSRILSEALGLFVERGFDAVTVEEIADRADVGKGTVFNYFPKKTAFLTAVYKRWLGQMDEDLGPVDSWKGPAHAQLDRMFNYMADQSTKHMDLSRLIILESIRQTHHCLVEGENAESEGTGEAEEEGFRLLERFAAQVIHRAKGYGDIRSEVEEDHAASVVAAAMFLTLARRLSHGGSVGDMKSDFSAQLDIIFRGMGP